jgi:Na+-transporting methylmalonyl-CoA/oxaloacetate decarboxylase gamma subunit
LLPFTDSYWQGIDKAFYMQYRPPLFNLILGFAFSIFGASFEIAKLVVILFNTSVLLPVYFIAKRLYNERCAIYSAILLVTINSYFLSLTFEVFVYSAGAYFSLCFFYLYIRRGEYWNYASILAALSYLTHPSSLIMIISLILIELIKSRYIIFEKINIKYFYPIFIFILIISPWLIRNYIIFENPFYTNARYASLMRNWEDYCTLNAPTLKCYLEFILTPINFLKTKIGSIFLTFFPRPYSITFSTWDIQALWNPVKLNWAMTGLLSYPLLAVVLYLLIKKPCDRICLLFYIGLALALILVGFRVGYMQSFLLPQCILLGIAGINIIKNKKIFIFLIGIILILQCMGIVYNKYKLKEIPNQKLYSWIKNNISEDEKIMNCDIHAIAYFTGRGGFITPNEDIKTILNCIKKWQVDYFIIGEVDLRLRDIDIDKVEKVCKFLKEIDKNKIYKVR